MSRTLACLAAAGLVAATFIAYREFSADQLPASAELVSTEGASTDRATQAAGQAAGSFEEQVRGDLTPAEYQDEHYEPPQEIAVPRRFTYGGAERVWYGLGPEAGASSGGTVILLHGSARDGRAMLDMWQDVARSENLVLIAPNSRNSYRWSSDEGRDFLNALLDDAAKTYAIDRDRLYLFGHSAGANQALFLAHEGSLPWRAVGVHAGAYAVNDATAPRNPAPVFVYVGDQDDIFDVDGTRSAAQTFAATGHRVDFQVIPNHSHWYYEIGPALARDAWLKFSE